MRGFKSIFVSSKHKIKCFLIHEKYFQTTNAVDTLPLIMINVLSYDKNVEGDIILIRLELTKSMKALSIDP